tara:strand:- start:634 stop:1980 length:1347 start_codon:yes stop_codon:yes gene_type:complete
MEIIIIGAGSAGLLSALMIKNKIPKCNITIIKDPDTKVIGVGESTVGSFITMLKDHIGIDIDDFIKNVKPVTKHGLLFNFGKKDFNYSFDRTFDLEQNGNYLPNGFYFEGGDINHSEESTHIFNKTNTEPIYSKGGLNLNNKLSLEYLEKIAIEKGIKIINGKIISVERIDNNIKSLNKKHKADYFIDCSGFNSLLSEEKWVSYNDSLINDKALFFEITNKRNYNIRPYTQATTMKCGWLWEIDHADNTTSCGYVHSSKYTSDKESLKEVEQKLKIKIKDYRIIPFKTGRLEKHWVGNVITIGNADGFIEPLESTSLMIILQLSLQISYILKYGDKKNDLIDDYNKFVNKYYDNIRDFILIHFCFNNKINNKYWKDYKKRIGKLSKNSLGYEIVHYYLRNNTHIRFLTHTYNDENPFGLEGWYSILRGLIPTETDRKKWLVKLEKGKE